MEKISIQMFTIFLKVWNLSSTTELKRAKKNSDRYTPDDDRDDHDDKKIEQLD